MVAGACRAEEELGYAQQWAKWSDAPYEVSLLSKFVWFAKRALHGTGG